MSTSDTIRTIIELLLVLAAILMMIFEPHIAAWEQRAARKALVWALDNIPAFKAWLYGEPTVSEQIAAEYKPRIEIRHDWRGRS